MSTDSTAPARRLYEALDTGELDLVNEALAPDWEAIPTLANDLPGPAGFKELIGFLRGVFPDFTVTVHDVVASGDRVAVRATASGTHSAELLGIPATGREVTYAACDIHRVSDGRIVQSWHLEDYFGLLSQLGATFTTPSPTR